MNVDSGEQDQVRLVWSHATDATSGTCPARASAMGGLRVIWRIRGEREIIGHPRPGTLK